MPNRKTLSSSSYDIFANSTLIRYTILPSIFLSVVAAISVDPYIWIASDVHHFYFEMVAVILSAIVAFYCITRAYTLREKFSLFVGIGFVTITIIDFLHAVFSFNAAGNSIFLQYFIPQTWFAGRTFLAAMLVIAVLKYAPLIGGAKEEREGQIVYDRQSHKEDDDRLHNTLLFPLITLAVLAISVVAFSFFTTFPIIVVTNSAIHRPYEIPSLALFSIALLYFYRKKIYKTNDFFYKGILGALVIDIFGEIIMSFSASNFHTAHNIAHILKNSGYFIIIISLAMSSIQYNKMAKEKEQVIRVQYERLKKSDKMKDEFINVAAHELRTPIQPILSLTEVLRSKVKDIHEQELMDVVIRNAKRLQRLTEDILDVTKIESGSLNLKKEFFNLNDVITNSIDDLIANVVKKNQQGDLIKLSYRPHDIFIEADKARITQVISNILSNAIKFTEATVNKESGKERGIININAEKHDNLAIVSVKDTGTGIDPDVFPRLFTKFVMKSDKGTGLGLYISKSIVEAHGGKIWAENNNDDGNEGATFTFTLPRSEKREANKR
ncbi:MAG: ATP-binding protein [Nitrososphaeraceae archaeon]